MFNSYKSLGAVWSTATSFIAGAIHYGQDKIKWITADHAFEEVPSIAALNPLEAGHEKGETAVTTAIASVASHAIPDFQSAMGMVSTGIANTGKSAATLVTDMASSAGATVLNAGYGPLASVYGTLSEKAGDCLHEVDQQMQDLAGWARGDDPYPRHFGVSLQDAPPPDDSFSAQTFLAGVRDWFTGAAAADTDY